MKYYNYLKIFLKSVPKIRCKRKVDFLICGTQKGGTTALFRYMSRHNELGMASRKEIHFFDKDRFFYKNKSYFPIYHSFFNFNSGHTLYGEATPDYIYLKDAPLRISKYNPEIKLIIILRNPIERAFSHWNMNCRQQYEKLPFMDAIVSEKERINKCLPKQDIRYSYVDRGFYVDQIKRIWQFFPKKQTLIVRNERLREKPLDTLNEIYKFLGVSSIDKAKSVNANSSDYSFDIKKEEKEYLFGIYKEEIKNLENLLGWDCSDWLEV